LTGNDRAAHRAGSGFEIPSDPGDADFVGFDCPGENAITSED
jgi:hypothetical protein